MKPTETRQDSAEQTEELRQQLREILSRNGTGEEHFPLSYSQLTYWFFVTLVPEVPVYINTLTFDFRGDLNEEYLSRAVMELVRKNRIFHTHFPRTKGDPYQAVPRGFAPPPLEVVDLTELGPEGAEGEARRLVELDARTVFDIFSAAPFRARLLRLEPERRMLLMSIHHILLDAKSEALLSRQMAATYRALTAGESPPPAPSVQYADYAVWQQGEYTGERLKRSVDYWRERITGMPRGVLLPASKQRPRRPSFAGGSRSLAVSESTRRALEELSRDAGVTPFILLLAALGATYYKQTGMEDLPIGTILDVRDRPELGDIIGDITNTIALRLKPAPEIAFREYLLRTRDEVVGDFEHRELPSLLLMDSLQLERTAGVTTLANTVFQMHDIETLYPTLDFGPGLELELNFKNRDLSGVALADLRFEVMRGRDRLYVDCEYSSELFDPEDVDAILKHYVAVLDRVASAPDSLLRDMPEYAGVVRQDRIVLTEDNHAVQNHAADGKSDATTPARRNEKPVADVYIAATFTAEPLAAHLHADVGAATFAAFNQVFQEVLDGHSAFGRARRSVVLFNFEDWLDLQRTPDEIRETAATTAGELLVAIAGGNRADVLCICPSRPELEAEYGDLFEELSERFRMGLPRTCIVTPAEILAAADSGDYYNVRSRQIGRIPYHDSFYATLGRVLSAVLKTLPPRPSTGGLINAHAARIFGMQEFLKGLKLEVTIAAIGEDEIPGVALLSHRSLAFNFTAKQRLAPELSEALNDRECWTVRVRDRFGDYGLVGAVIFQQTENGRLVTELDSFILDCKALGRRVEHRMLGAVAERTADIPGALLKIPFQENDKNEIAREFLESLFADFFDAEAGAYLVPAARAKALIEKEEGGLERHEYVAPRNEYERRIAGGMQELLRLERVSVYDCFFQIGGNSIRAAQLVSLPELDAEIDLQDVFLAQSPALLAGVMLGRKLAGFEPEVVERLVGTLENPPVELLPKDELPEGLDEQDAYLSFVEGLSSDQTAQLIDLVEGGAPAGDGVAPVARPVATRTVRKRETIPTVRRDEPLPLSPAQMILWSMERHFHGSASYNLPLVLEIQGRLDIALLQDCINETIARHEILRTSFVFEDDEPRQRIHAERPVGIGLADLRSYPPLEREKTALLMINEELLRPFDLEREPLIRPNLIQLEERTFLLLVNIHHIVYDGPSAGILTREIWKLYAAARRGEQPDLPELPVQYADYAVWRHYSPDSGRSKTETQLSYWRRQLKGMSAASIPYDHQRSLLSSMASGALRLYYPAVIVDRLRQIAEESRATLHIVVLAAFYVLLERYTGRDDLAILSAVSRRDRPEFWNLVGFFVNGVILRTSLDGDPDFRDLVGRTRHTVVEAHANSGPSISKVTEECQVPAPALFFQLLDVTTAEELAPLEDLRVVPVSHGEGNSRFDLEFHLGTHPNGAMGGLLMFNRGVYEEDTMLRLARHFYALLDALGREPDRKLADVSLIGADERELVLKQWNRTRSPLPEDALIHELFDEHARRRPDAIALSFGSDRYSYGQLRDESKRIAAALRERYGVGPEAPVAVYMERSPEYVFAVLAVLRAGGAYVPLDPAYPRARLRSMLADSGARVILGLENRSEELKAFGLPVVAVDALRRSREPVAAPSPPATQQGADGLAYVMYTSGSTGTPRGVGVTHRNVIRLVRSQAYVRMGPGQVSLLLAPLSFDASTFEIWSPLLNGGELVVYPPGLPAFRDVARLIENRKITTLWLTAGLFHRMVESDVEHLRGVGELLTGGDVVSVWHARRYLGAGGGRLVNGYGPTENTTFTSTYAMTQVQQVGDLVSIGRPISNTEIYVLDSRLEPCPVGVAGELYTAGDGLSRGYTNDPALTAERFLPNPFTAEPGQRMYRTGDLARWLPDGNLQFLGRVDEQIKVNGHRIEPGEIETVLREHPGVGGVVVLMRYRPGGRTLEELNFAPERELVAYVQPAGPSPRDENELRRELAAFLASRLPSHLVPAAFELLEEIPLTANGKVDRQSLLAREIKRFIPELPYEPPANAAERKLVEIWQRLLGREKVGVYDNFFQMGGTSMLAVRMHNEMRRELGKDVPLALFLANPTIRSLARVARRGAAEMDTGPLVIVRPVGSRPPLFCVHPMGGNAFCYLNLARQLGEDQPFYAFQWPGFQSGRLYWSVEELARLYVEKMRDLQPQGPYYLGGWSFGGQIAFEMARQLNEVGEETAILALFDTIPPELRGTSLPGNPFKLLMLLGLVVRDVFLSRIKSYDDLRWVAESYGLVLPPASQVLNLQMDEILEIAREFFLDLPRVVTGAASTLLALLNYSPPAFDFERVVLFRAEEDLPPGGIDPVVAGWQTILGHTPEVQLTPGTHATIVNHEHAGALAERLRLWLARARHTQAET